MGDILVKSERTDSISLIYGKKILNTRVFGQQGNIYILMLSG